MASTKTRRLPKRRPVFDIMQDERVRALTLALLERMNQALETTLETNKALARAVEKLADGRIDPDGRTVVYLPKPAK